MVGISLVKALLALKIGPSLPNLLRPGDHRAVSATNPKIVAQAKKLDFLKELVGCLLRA